MTSRFPPFAFVELVSPYNKKNITRWLEDMNFMFSWQEQYLTRSLRSLVRYCSCHSNIKFISSRHRVISSMYLFVFHSICITGFLGLTHLQMLFNWTDCVDFIDQRSSRKRSLSRLIQFAGNHAKEGKEDFSFGIKLESARQ